MQERLNDLSLLYKLFSPIQNGSKPISDKFRMFMINKGKNLVKSVETKQNGKYLGIKEVLHNSQIIENLLKLQSSENKIVQQCF